MNDIVFFKTQLQQLRGLLETAGDDPILAPQLQERLDEVQRKLQAAETIPGSLFKRPTDAPRAAVFITEGRGVVGSQAVRAALAGELLQQYEKMFAAQVVHDERALARSAGRKRRPRQAAAPTLWLVGTPRGSFGFELAAQTDGPEAESPTRSLFKLAETIVRVASAGATANLQDVPPAVLPSLSRFLRTLAKYDVGLRLVSDEQSRSIAAPDIQSVANRLEREIIENEREMRGKFRGVTLDSGHFDFQTDAGESISGVVAEELDEDQLLQFETLVNKPAIAKILETRFEGVSGDGTTRYTLLSVLPTAE